MGGRSELLPNVLVAKQSTSGKIAGPLLVQTQVRSGHFGSAPVCRHIPTCGNLETQKSLKTALHMEYFELLL